MIDIDLSKGWTKAFEKWPINNENPWWLTLIAALTTFMIISYFIW